MTDLFADIPTDGEKFEGIEENETSTESQTENKQEEESPTSQGEESEDEVKADEAETETEDSTDDENNLPFHKHPRFKQLTDEKNSLKETVKGLTEELSKFKEEMGEKLSHDNETVKIPDWFSRLYGDDEEAWSLYKNQDSNNRQQMKKEILEEIRQEEIKQKEEAEKLNSWVDENIQSLKDEGLKFDKNKLMKIAVDYRPTDEKGNIDFKKAYNILQALEKNTSDTKRKEVADSTIKSKPESKKDDIPNHFSLKNKDITDFI